MTEEETNIGTSLAETRNIFMEGLHDVYSKMAEQKKEILAQLQEHMNQDLVHAHPRNGDPLAVLQYLGLDMIDPPNGGPGIVAVVPPAKDNRTETKAEEVV